MFNPRSLESGRYIHKRGVHRRFLRVTFEQLESRHLLTPFGFELRTFISDLAPSAKYGSVVALAENHAVVGAPGSGDSGSETGAAFVLARTDSFSSPQELVVDDLLPGDRFGSAVAMDGQTAVVAAPFADGAGNRMSSGTAYVFELVNGQWQEAAVLIPDDSAKGQLFGTSVSISGDRIVVGAPFGNAKRMMTGAAYVFERDTGGTENWGQVQKLAASDGGFADEFGTSVSIDGDTIVVGANRDDDRGQDAGAIYVFSDVGTADRPWRQTSKLTVGNGRTGDCFGFSVSVSEDTIAVGAFLHDDASFEDAGIAYVFSRSGAGSWNLTTELSPIAPDSRAHFGRSVAIDGDYVVVGAQGGDGNDTDTGAAYVFERNLGGSDNWGRRSTPLIASDGAMGDAFGSGVTVLDRSPAPLAAVGASLDDNSTDTGSTYFYLSQAMVEIAGTVDGAEEGSQDGQFSVTQNGLSNTDTVVSYNVSGTADSGSDFEAPSGSVTIPAGMLTATIPVTVIDDAVVEDNEEVTVFLVAISSGDPDVSIDPDAQSASIRLTDNDNALLMIEPISDGNEAGALAGAFRVALSTESSSDTTVNYSVSGTATAGADFAELSGMVTIRSGDTAATLEIPVVNDQLVEATETVVIQLTTIASGNSKISIDSALDQATVQVLDDDRATLAIDDVSASEAGGALMFSLTTDTPIDIPLQVDLTFQDGTATGNGDDYVSLPQRRILAANDSSAITVLVPITNDNRVELDESFSVSLSTATILDGRDVDVSDTGTGTIQNDDQATLSINDVTLDEQDANSRDFRFVVTLDNQVDVGSTVRYSTSDGTARVDDDDYVAADGTLTFLGTAGETQFVSVPVIGDMKVEGDETFSVNLTNLDAMNRNVVLADSQGVATIRNDDFSTLSIDDAVLMEGDDGSNDLVFTVTLNAEVDGGLTVTYATTDGTARADDDDYVPATGTLTFQGLPGEMQTFAVPVLGDTKVESDETVIVDLMNLSAMYSAVTLGDSQAVGRIDNDDRATLSIDDAELTEGDVGTNTLFFTVALDQAVDIGFDLEYATVDDTAEVGDNDYVAASGTLSFAGRPGETQSFAVLLVGDAKVEGEETFVVNLTNLNATGRDVVLADPQASGTIFNDDRAFLSIEDAQLTEGDNGMSDLVFSVSLDSEVDGGLTVDYASADDTARVDDGDYVATSGTLTFQGLATEEQTFAVPVLGDTKVEADETFTVSLTNLNAMDRDVTLPDAQGMGTILNDDSAGLSVDDAQLIEGDDGSSDLVFTVTLDAEVDRGLTVDYATSDETALINDNDYVSTSGTLAFQGLPGEVQTFAVPVLGDVKVEPNDTLLVTLSNLVTSRNVTLLRSLGRGTILDNDVLFVEFATAAASDLEAMGGNLPQLLLRGTLVTDGLLSVSVSGGTATADTDFTNTASVTIPAGTYDGTLATAVGINLSIIDDADDEPDQTIQLTLDPRGDLMAGDVNGDAITQRLHTYTILDDDVVLVEFATATASDLEAVGGNLPQLLLRGTLVTDGLVSVSVSGGTATADTDFTNTASVTIPAGTYDGALATAVGINLSIIDDADDEPDQTIQLTLDPRGDLMAGDVNGDAITQRLHTYTILDDDVVVQELFASIGGGQNNPEHTGKIVSVDLDSGTGSDDIFAGEPVRNLENNSVALTGLAFSSGGTLYVSTRRDEGGNDLSELVQIDANQLDVLQIDRQEIIVGLEEDDEYITDLAVQPGTDVVFAVSEKLDGNGIPTNRLYTIDTSPGSFGDASIIGTLDNISAIAFAPNSAGDNGLFATGPTGRLVELNPTDGGEIGAAQILFGVISGADGLGAVQLNLNGDLTALATEFETDRIVAVDLMTGETSLVGDTGFGSTTDIDIRPQAGGGPPVLVPADFDDNGVVDVFDINELFQQLRTGAQPDMAFDLNQDGLVNNGDRDDLIFNRLGTSFGDANLDGVFDSNDLQAVLQFNEFDDGIAGNSGWATGDWNGDGEFDVLDLVLALETNAFSGGVA